MADALCRISEIHRIVICECKKDRRFTDFLSFLHYKVRIVSASERTYWNAALIFPKNSNTVEKMFFTVRKKDAIPEAALETLSIVP